jgi:putative oxidoreductase
MACCRRLLATNAPAAVILIRLIVGAVFLSEGIQKFLYPDALGVGRFTKIGILNPEIMAPFVGVCEIECGVLFLIGLLTRFAAVTMIINMLVAISTKKVPMLLHDGFWKMAHEARTDWAMLLGSIFLLLVGAGSWSLDAVSAQKTTERKPNGCTRKPKETSVDRPQDAYLEPTQETGRALFGRKVAGSVVMLNLLRFRKVADYSATPHLAPDEPITGAAAYRLYVEHALPHLEKSGGEPSFVLGNRRPVSYRTERRAVRRGDAPPPTKRGRLPCVFVIFPSLNSLRFRDTVDCPLATAATREDEAPTP